MFTLEFYLKSYRNFLGTTEPCDNARGYMRNILCLICGNSGGKQHTLYKQALPPLTHYIQLFQTKPRNAKQPDQ